MKNGQIEIIEKRFLQELDHHLEGLKAKILEDFSTKSFENEIRLLKSDPIYTKFGLDSQEYALIRLMGRISVSIGRRLGEIYDKIPRFIARSVFDIPLEQIAPKLTGKFELDICLPFEFISKDHAKHIKKITAKFCPKVEANGIGIEIRYNFNPNDSSRLRKDEAMAGYLRDKSLSPVYLIFSSISPRDEAISRLKRAGWIFIVGQDAIDYTKDLFGMDMSSIMDQQTVKKEISTRIKEIMNCLYQSSAFKKVAASFK
jgi:hypothetical protein